MIKFRYNNFLYEINGIFKYFVTPINKKVFFNFSKQLRNVKDHEVYLNEHKLDDKYSVVRYIELNHDFFNIGDIKKNKLIKEFLYSFFNNNFHDILNERAIVEKIENINEKIPKLEFLYNDNLKKIIDVIFTTRNHIASYYDFALMQMELFRYCHSDNTLIVIEFPENYLTEAEIIHLIKVAKNHNFEILIFTNIPFVFVEDNMELESINFFNKQETDFINGIQNYEVFLNYLEENSDYNNWEEIILALKKSLPLNLIGNDQFEQLFKKLFY